MNIQEKELFLRQVEENDSHNVEIMTTLMKLAQDRSPFIRIDAIELLVDYPTSEVEDLLLTCLNDKNELVRTEAVDALSIFQSKFVYDHLRIKASEDPCYLVRAYAISSLTDVAKSMNHLILETIAFIIERSFVERRILIKLNCYRSLYILGNKEYLNEMLAIIHSKNYRNRCAVANILADVINNENSEKILEFVKARLEMEDTIAVKSTINEFLEYCKRERYLI